MKTIDDKDAAGRLSAESVMIIKGRKGKNMRRNRRDSIKKERIIMITSSALVLAALTMTGLYMKGKEMEEQNDGYTLDLAALEKDNADKLEEIGKGNIQEEPIIGGSNAHNMDSDLDYMPMEEDLSAEAGSHLVELPGQTAGMVEDAPKDGALAELSAAEELEADQAAAANAGATAEPVNQGTAELNYSEDKGLTRPVSGEILLPYSMEGSIYFATLDQYKYNPATIFAAEEGTEVVACAEGRITSVFETAELGKGVTVELGNGYVVTYGQLADIQVEENGIVKAGEKIGSVASPSRYYSLEGTNLYFKLEKDGAPVNSEGLF
ncbi:MAG: M23 family metallopeptidase [Lachnospiraceae bacterium]|nr:M23 family metallopeptidase [Lachnospiraceae bacterium]